MTLRRTFLHLLVVAGAGVAFAGLAAPAASASPDVAKAKVRVTLIRWPYT